MHVLVTGGTGFIGRRLIDELIKRQDRVTLLARNFDKAKSLFNGHVNLIGSMSDAVSDIDAVVNLAGEPIVDRRWSKKRKQVLKESRINITNDIVDWISHSEHKPEVLISGSAIGFYGNYPENITITEADSPRYCFSSELCRDWESAAFAAEALGVRVCAMRTGVVLNKNEGALKRMWLPFQLGLGGPIGHGRQWFSWIHWQDMIRLLLYVIDNKTISGPVNATATYPVSNAEFSRQLGLAMGRPAFMPMPSVVVQLLFGESSELLLQGQQVIPKKLIDHGFTFNYPQLKPALDAIVQDE